MAFVGAYFNTLRDKVATYDREVYETIEAQNTGHERIRRIARKKAPKDAIDLDFVKGSAFGQIYRKEDTAPRWRLFLRFLLFPFFPSYWSGEVSPEIFGFLSFVYICHLVSTMFYFALPGDPLAFIQESEVLFPFLLLGFAAYCYASIKGTRSVLVNGDEVPMSNRAMDGYDSGEGDDNEENNNQDALESESVSDSESESDYEPEDSASESAQQSQRTKPKNHREVNGRTSSPTRGTNLATMSRLHTSDMDLTLEKRRKNVVLEDNRNQVQINGTGKRTGIRMKWSPRKRGLNFTTVDTKVEATVSADTESHSASTTANLLLRKPFRRDTKELIESVGMVNDKDGATLGTSQDNGVQRKTVDETSMSATENGTARSRSPHNRLSVSESIALDPVKSEDADGGSHTDVPMRRDLGSMGLSVDEREHRSALSDTDHLAVAKRNGKRSGVKKGPMTGRRLNGLYFPVSNLERAGSGTLYAMPRTDSMGSITSMISSTAQGKTRRSLKTFQSPLETEFHARLATHMPSTHIASVKVNALVWDAPSGGFIKEEFDLPRLTRVIRAHVMKESISKYSLAFALAGALLVGLTPALFRLYTASNETAAAILRPNQALYDRIMQWRGNLEPDDIFTRFAHIIDPSGLIVNHQFLRHLVSDIIMKVVTTWHIIFGYTWESMFIVVTSMLACTVVVSMILTALAVAEHAYKHRFLDAKFFRALTSSRKAAQYGLPYFRLSKVRNIKMWLSLRSFLKRKGPQRAIDLVISNAFLHGLLLLFTMSFQVMSVKEGVFLRSLANWQLFVASTIMSIHMLRFLTLGSAINEKYTNSLPLMAEQINLQLRLARTPHKKDEITICNNVLNVSTKLLKDIESPYKVAGLSMNPVLFNIVRVLVLSAFSAVISEFLGFKLKVWKLAKMK
eukprot:Clim_evm44s195 gene=Clim_evmTU44s195